MTESPPSAKLATRNPSVERSLSGRGIATAGDPQGSAESPWIGKHRPLVDQESGWFLYDDMNDSMWKCIHVLFQCFDATVQRLVSSLSNCIFQSTDTHTGRFSHVLTPLFAC